MFLGFGGRLIMRGPAIWDGRSLAFNWGGTLEILFYVGLVGGISGFFYSLASDKHRKHWLRGGLICATISYALTLLTLPAHIAAATRTFATAITLVQIPHATLYCVFAPCWAGYCDHNPRVANELFFASGLK